MCVSRCGRLKPSRPCGTDATRRDPQSRGGTDNARAGKGGKLPHAMPPAALKRSGYFSDATRGSAAKLGLKVSRAFAATMSCSRSLRLLVLKSSLALGACALGLGVAGSTDQSDVADRSVRAEMPGDREIVNSANGD
jgi:hypothetical protein